MGAQAGYSGTPLPAKLGIRAGHAVLLAGAPPGFERALVPLPEDVRLARAARGSARFDVIVLFAPRRKDLVRGFAAARKRLVENGGLWVGWPKRAAGVDTDLTEDVVRAHGLAQGLVDNKVCAIDATWSGLRFVVRLRDRKGG